MLSSSWEVKKMKWLHCECVFMILAFKHIAIFTLDQNSSDFDIEVSVRRRWQHVFIDQTTKADTQGKEMENKTAPYRENMNVNGFLKNSVSHMISCLSSCKLSIQVRKHVGISRQHAPNLNKLFWSQMLCVGWCVINMASSAEMPNRGSGRLNNVMQTSKL